MHVELRAEDQRFVEEQVRAGRYPTAEALVHDALALIRVTPRTMEELREMVDVGLDQIDRGESAPWDAKDVKRRLRERFAK